MSHIFVSYNSKDRKAAHIFVEKLRKKELDIWFDQDQGTVGDRLGELIEKGMRDAQAFVVLLGESLGPWQTLEVEVGIRDYVYQGRPLFPVLLNGADPENIPMLLRGLMYLDLRNIEPDDDTCLDRLAFAIKSRKKGGFYDHVRELHMFDRDFLQVLLYKFSLLRSNSGVQLDVEFDHRTPSIATREARRFVRLNTPQFKTEAARLEQILESVYAGTRDVFNHEHDEFAFRYASGGTVPIVDIDGAEYYCLFLRGLHPIGWNLANGGCNSIEELRNPTKTIIRELQEELIIIDSEHWHVFDSPNDDRLDRPEFAASRDYWNSIFDKLGLHRFNQLKQQLLQIPPPEGPDTLMVKYLQEPPVKYDSLFVSITTEDYGIEVDRVLKLSLDDEGLILCDGEINATNSVNRPVGLFRVEGFDLSNDRIVPKFFFYSAKRYDGFKFEEVVNDLVIPDMKESDPPLPEYAVHEFQAASKTGFRLCPVAHRLLRRVAENRS